MRLALLAFIACIALSTVPPIRAAAQTESRMADAEWRHRFIEKQAELRAKPVEMIFLGDSILHSFEWVTPDPVWDHWYGGRHAVDLGFNGDGVAHVIWRVEHGELDGISPKLVVVLIGTNDLWMQAPAIVGNISALVGAIHAHSPASRIVVLGILPSGKSAAALRVAHSVNSALAAMYGKPGALATYQDVSCVFLRDGKLNAELFREQGATEKLHPTLRGMDLLAARIEPVVSAMLGDKRRSTAGYPQETDCRRDTVTP